MKEELTGSEKEDGETYSDYNIKCPYCGYIIQDSWEYGSITDEEIECPECMKIMKVTSSHVVSYTAKKKEK